VKLCAPHPHPPRSSVILQKPFTWCGVFDTSSPTCSSCSLLTDVTEAMDDTCTSLAALLSTEYHLLEAGQVTQLGSVEEGENCLFKAASAKGKKNWYYQMYKSSRKSQVSLTNIQETHPGRSVLLLLECTAKTFSFSWSQWYSTPEFKALETPKKEKRLA